jgi:hypothetical protein
MESSSFKVGQRVTLKTPARGYGYESLVPAVVRKVTATRITIEYEVKGETVIRVVTAGRLSPSE